MEVSFEGKPGGNGRSRDRWRLAAEQSSAWQLLRNCTSKDWNLLCFSFGVLGAASRAVQDTALLCPYSEMGNVDCL